MRRHESGLPSARTVPFGRRDPTSPRADRTTIALLVLAAVILVLLSSQAMRDAATTPSGVAASSEGSRP